MNVPAVTEPIAPADAEVTRIERPTLHNAVVSRLRDMITEGQIPPGVRIHEGQLGKQLGVSRTPLREALKVLAAEGLVNLIPRRGCYVTEISEQDLDEIFPLLAILEGRCAFEATQKATAKDLKRLEALHRALEGHAAAGQIEQFFETNQEFHTAIQELAANRWVTQVILDLRKVLKLTRLHSLTAEGRIEQSQNEHRAILAAMLARDPAAAELAMQAHLSAGRMALAKIGTKKTEKTAKAA